MLILVLLACAWPSSAPSPSQPLLLETSPYGLADTGGSDSPPEAGHPRPEAVDPAPQTSPQAGGADAGADPGLGGVP